MAVSAQIHFNVTARVTKTADLSSPAATAEISGTYTLANGTGTNQVNLLHADSHSMSESQTKDYDLAGSLTDPLGVAAVFAKVKAVIIKAGASNPGDLKIGADAAAFVGFFDDASDELILPPGESIMLLATKSGKAVTATTADILQFASAASAGTYTFDVMFLGTDA